jgi:hypothetical protein
MASHADRSLTARRGRERSSARPTALGEGGARLLLDRSGRWDTLAATETRVLATDPAARNAVGRYRMVIRGPSGCICRDWLRAVAHRANSAGAA